MASSTTKTSKIKIELTQEQAEKLGLVRCRCGHPPNNHFDFDNKPCAHCTCKVYRQIIKLPPDSWTVCFLNKKKLETQE